MAHMSMFKISTRPKAALFACLVVSILAGCGPSTSDEPLTGGVPPEMRRLTEDQYRHVVSDIFGDDIVLGGRFDPTIRSNGLISVGASTVTISPSAFERYDYLARSIAAQVVDKNHRGEMIACKPADPKAPDDACAKQFLGRVGRLLYRRPLSQDEIDGSAAIAKSATAATGDFYAGLGASLGAMMETPAFLYVSDRVEPDPDHKGAFRLDAYSKAARLSFFLWNSSPDDALLTAAQKGELNSRSGLAKQVDRMIASPRIDAGTRAFFADMLMLDDIDTLQKDTSIYPAFGLRVAADAREETLRTITDLLLVKHADYRDLFTTRETYLSSYLGLIYKVPVQNPEGWIQYQYPPDESPERVGIQSQISFVALHAHPGSSSATIRGRAVREILLCQKVPDPPGNVDFTLFSDGHNPVYKTARQRLAAHATVPSCAGCHKLVDPIGLAMEDFDGAGSLRSQENGAPIDTTGDLDGVKYKDAAGLGAALHDNPNIPACLVNRLYAYASGHNPAKSEAAWLAYTGKQFADSGYKFTELLHNIAMSNALYAVSTNKPPSSQRSAGAAPGDKEKPL
jgi:hypothetical protein